MVCTGTVPETGQAGLDLPRGAQTNALMPHQQKPTYYDTSARRPPARPSIHGETRADVCIIGGGYTGLSAALHLAQQGASVVLAEALQIGSGASGRNGGQIHTGLRKDQQALERWLGPQHAQDLWALAEEAKSHLRDLVERHQISCTLKAGLIIAAHDDAALRDLGKDADYLSRAYGYTQVRMLDAAETTQQLGSTVYLGARFDSGGGHLQPLDFAAGWPKQRKKLARTFWSVHPRVQ